MDNGRQGKTKVKEMSKQAHGHVKARSGQHKHNLNRNNNLMGIEFNLANLVVSFVNP